jgi:hypothetical protein
VYRASLRPAAFTAISMGQASGDVEFSHGFANNSTLWANASALDLFI